MKPVPRRNPSDRTRPLRAAQQRGVVLVCVLVSLSIATTLAVTATHAVLKQRSRLRSERQLRQAELLVDAGWRRALAKLEDNNAYNGETWRLEAGSLPGFPAAAVRIEVARAPRPAVTVVATLPAGAATPVKRSHRYPFPLTTAERSPSAPLEPVAPAQTPVENPNNP